MIRLILFRFEAPSGFPADSDSNTKAVATKVKHFTKLFRALQLYLLSHFFLFVCGSPQYNNRSVDLIRRRCQQLRTVIRQRNQLQQFLVRPKFALSQHICIDAEVGCTQICRTSGVEPNKNVSDMSCNDLNSVRHAGRGKSRCCQFLGFSTTCVASGYPDCRDCRTCGADSADDVPDIFSRWRKHSQAEHYCKHKADCAECSSEPFPKLIHRHPFRSAS